MITKNNVRDYLINIRGQSELSNDELMVVYHNLSPIFGVDMQYIGNGTIILVTKDYKKYQLEKTLYFCCGCSEFTLEFEGKKIYLAFDY